MDENRVLYTSIFLIVEALLTIVNIFGNSIICYVMICKRKLKQTSNYFILSVAVSGLSIAFVAKPIALIWVRKANQWRTFCAIEILKVLLRRTKNLWILCRDCNNCHNALWSCDPLLAGDVTWSVLGGLLSNLISEEQQQAHHEISCRIGLGRCMYRSFLRVTSFIREIKVRREMWRLRSFHTKRIDGQCGHHDVCLFSDDHSLRLHLL